MYYPGLDDAHASTTRHTVYPHGTFRRLFESVPKSVPKPVPVNFRRSVAKRAHLSPCFIYWKWFRRTWGHCETSPIIKTIFCMANIVQRFHNPRQLCTVRVHRKLYILTRVRKLQIWLALFLRSASLRPRYKSA